jgi:dCMP deaminase
MKQRELDLYMDIALRVAQMSYAKRLQVGAVLVKDRNIISFGYNGTPTGWDNCCEEELRYEDGGVTLKTMPEVIHAEENAILKAARDGRATSDSTLIITHAPCIMCSKLVLNAGIKEVVYKDTYRNNFGILFLMKGGINVRQYSN